MSHANAPLKSAGRRLLVERTDARTTLAEVVRQMGPSKGSVAM